MGYIACYLRISKDRDDLRQGVARQEADCRRYAGQQWPEAAVEVFCDNDLTAADPDVARPAYEALLAAVRAGDVTQVVATEQSRLTRQPAEWESLCLALQRAGVDQVHTVRNGPIAVAPESRLIGRVLAAVDAEEVERLRARTRRAHAQLAAEGRPSGGRRYGYRNTRDPAGRPALEIDETEASVIRTMADMVLAGQSTGAVAQALNDRGIPTPRRAAEWWRTTIRSTLLSPYIAGLRSHHGEIVGTATWDPILDEATWRAVRAQLTGEIHVVGSDGQTRRVARSRRGRPRTYLLSGGTLVCAVCDQTMVSAGQAHRTGRVPAYACRKTPTRLEACGGPSIMAEPLDAYVGTRVAAWFDPARLAASTDDDGGRVEELAREVADADRRLAEAAALFGAGEISTSEWRQIRDVAGARAERARAELERAPSGVDVVQLAGIVDRWGVASVAEQRLVVAAVVDEVRVSRATPGAKRFDTDRVTIRWRER